MPLPARINLVTLGVRDMERSRAFYQALGFSLSGEMSNDQVSFFALGNLVFGLFGRADLAKDAGVADDGGKFCAVSLAINVESREAADAAMQAAADAGAAIVKPARDVFWGGYSGYFSDPDGHLWEVAFNPFFPLDENGLCRLPA